MSNIHAALGLAQLEQLDKFIHRKRAIGRLYTDLLQQTPGLQLPLSGTNYAENLYWVYAVVLDEDVAFDAAAMMAKLAAEKIGTRPFFWPMHEQPVFLRRGWFKDESHPVAERIARRGFYVPAGLATTDEQIGRVASAVRKCIA